MNTLVRSTHAGFADDDAQGYEYTQSSIARLAGCLGADFAPYLPFVVPPLIETASKAVRDSGRGGICCVSKQALGSCGANTLCSMYSIAQVLAAAGASPRHSQSCLLSWGMAAVGRGGGGATRAAVVCRSHRHCRHPRAPRAPQIDVSVTDADAANEGEKAEGTTELVVSGVRGASERGRAGVRLTQPRA